MSILNVVEWPVVFRRLLDDADDELRERAYFYTGLRTPFRPAFVFAAVVCGSSGIALFQALRDLDTDAAIVVKGWLQGMAHVALGAAGEYGVAALPAAPAGALLLDPDLEHLPLLDLAADIARVGGLAAVVGTLRPGIAGLYNSTERRITLDLAQGADERSWAHELAHALDPLLGRRHAPEIDERFADELGALLLARLPATVEAARPLIAECQTRAGVRIRTPAGSESEAPQQGRPTGGLPEPGAESLAAFLFLPLGVGPGRSEASTHAH